MRTRSILLILLLTLILLFIWQPKVLWAEIKRIHSQWDLILKLLVTVIAVYLGYGVYRLWSGDVTWWPF
jgi:hypothetical protein